MSASHLREARRMGGSAINDAWYLQTFLQQHIVQPLGLREDQLIVFTPKR